ncbi:MAG: hypothetical protein U9R06_02145 [Patescibacteria group bacterium]|nr:hypothetical protein [Patescibacteria group bacterium]
MTKEKYSHWTVLIVVLAAILFSVFLLHPSWVIGSDGFGYYAYARSILFDGDLDFYNEYAFFDNLYNTKTVAGWMTPIGKTGNPFSVGPSILWSPFILTAETIQNTFNFYDEYVLPGYNLPFQLAIGLTTIFYTAIGLVLIFLSLNNFFKKSISWWSTILIFGISPLPYYLIYEPSMSHGLTVFSVSWLFYLSILWLKSKKNNNWLLLGIGLTSGLIFIIRWQDIIFTVIPMAIFFKKLYGSKDSPDLAKLILKSGALISAPLLTVAATQLFAWKHLYGSFVAIPQGAAFFNLTTPHLSDFLFSGYHGMFIIHPLLLLSIVGLFLIFKRQKLLITVFLLAIMAQVYLNSGLYDWYAGGSFGARRMISSLPIFAFGLSAFLERTARNKIAVVLVAILFIVGTVFNGLLMISYAKNIIPLNAPTTRMEVYSAPFKILKQLD